jgi:hypothetical protein
MTCPLVIPAATMRSPVKFGGTFEMKMKTGVIVDALVIGLARFSRALGLACGYRVPRREGL